jgi:hypothetical protein
MSPVKAVFFCLSLLSLATATAGLAARSPMDDGTLTVRDGRGIVAVKAGGSLIGRVNRGKIVVNPSSTGTTTVVVRGYQSRTKTAQGMTYTGANMRFRFADDRRFSVKLSGKGINFSAVGRGEAYLDGIGDPNAGFFFDGTYSLNGDAYKSLPDERTRVELRAPSPPPPPPARG